MLWLYSFFYFFLRLLLPLLGLFNPKIKQGLKLRKKKDHTWPWLLLPKNSQPLWFHCASGEFEYAKPVIREFKKNNPDIPVLVTFFSPSVEKSLSKNSNVDFYCPTPWDTSRHWRQFIEHHQPRALLIARTDLWPMMIHVAKTKNIPRLLFSKTVNKRKMGLLSFLSFFLMKQMNDIFCVTDDDKKLLDGRLGRFKNVHAAGDTRYDQCLYRLQNGNPIKPINNFNKPIFVAGSTWVADELWLLDLIKDSYREVSYILAPHEPSAANLERLEADLKKLDLKSQRYSETASWNPEAVLIVDQVGILADLYKWGQFAFVGGSVNRSVHSVMEPLAQGLLCFVGPNYENNREAMVFKNVQINDMTPVQVVISADELRRRFLTLYPSWTSDHQFNLQLAVKQKTGASKIVLKWIENNSRPFNPGKNSTKD